MKNLKHLALITLCSLCVTTAFAADSSRPVKTNTTNQGGPSPAARGQAHPTAAGKPDMKMVTAGQSPECVGKKDGYYCSANNLVKCTSGKVADSVACPDKCTNNACSSGATSSGVTENGAK